MKKKCLVLLFLSFFLSFVNAKEHLSIYQNEQSSTSKIALDGEFKKGGLRSATDPIIVDLRGKSLYIIFQENVGTVRLTITNDMGEDVYTANVNSVSQNSLIVHLMHLSSGMYTLSFVNEKGCMWGEFIL